MSPEGLISNSYGPKTDVWAFGILIYELLHGYTPLSTCKTEEELKKRVLEHPIFRNGISSGLISLVMKCLEVNEEKRITVKEIMMDSYM
jgi:serine/threonine-protein kinase ULK/ATG1